MRLTEKTRPWLAAALLVAATSAAIRYLSGSGLEVIVFGGLAPALTIGGAILLCRNPRVRVVLGNLLLTVVSVGLALVAAECALDWEATGTGPLHSRMTIPEQWKWRSAQVPGAAHAHYWHGHLHVYNDELFRTVGGYAREESARRMVVLGDSLTYGYGVAAADTYAEVLASLLRKSDPSVRIYNLGVPGHQSEDIVRTAAKWIPALAPELVIYGICLNDFLPSGVGQPKPGTAWTVPIFDAVKSPFESRTRLGNVVTEAYNQALIRHGLRHDFASDILKDLDSYQVRFRRNLADLNGLAVAATGKPVVALVLNQIPTDARLRRLSSIAEAAAVEAGMRLVPTAEFYEKFGDGNTQLHVSRWEGHPNERAHRIYATMLERALGPARP